MIADQYRPTQYRMTVLNRSNGINYLIGTSPDISLIPPNLIHVSKQETYLSGIKRKPLGNVTLKMYIEIPGQKNDEFVVLKNRNNFAIIRQYFIQKWCLEIVSFKNLLLHLALGCCDNQQKVFNLVLPVHINKTQKLLCFEKP